MYSFSRTSDFYGNNFTSSFDDVMNPIPFPSPLPPPPPHLHLLTPAADHHQLAEFESANMAHCSHSHSHSSGSTSGCSGYNSPSYETTTTTTATTQRPSLIQRSISSHSLQKNNNSSYNNNEGLHCHFINEFLDMDTSPVRRVFSTGDLHRMNMGQNGKRWESPLASESSMIIEAMNRACPYNPEEKKERIERYRTKRNQRNFTKKIKYACRKTLADSRPRIRGRFARNDEIEKNPQVQWSHIGMEEDDEDEENWINYLESISGNLLS
ncbi:hypothetical protein Q3G72_023774 [Acer saccharum]|nr:hypothetical protein Q3G72_019475 [Acer saccharum]KAK1588479.1 hypothetical protein Q3G72_023774 [Acer saccharum]